MSKLILKFILFFCFLASLAIAMVSDWRNYFRETFLNENALVLSTLKSDFFKDGRKIVFAKIKSNNKIFVEVYEEVLDGYQKQLAKLRVPDANDGYFHYRGQATNLALEDINGDGYAEVLVPTFDANHVAHLNVYTYNPATEQFELMPPGATQF